MVRGLGKVSEALGAFRYPPYKVPSDWPDIIFKSKTCEPSATLHIWYRVQISETKSLNLMSEALIEQIKQNTRWCKTGKSFFWNHLKIPSQAEALSRVRWIIENRFSSITLIIGQWPISIWTMLVFHLLTAFHPGDHTFHQGPSILLLASWLPPLYPWHCSWSSHHGCSHVDWCYLNKVYSTIRSDRSSLRDEDLL